MGGAVAEFLSEVQPTPLRRIGTRTFGESGDPRGLYAKFGFDPDGIAQSVKKFLSR
jgi:transketolase